jgi:hypothetical protein
MSGNLELGSKNLSLTHLATLRKWCEDSDVDHALYRGGVEFIVLSESSRPVERAPGEFKDPTHGEPHRRKQGVDNTT